MARYELVESSQYEADRMRSLGTHYDGTRVQDSDSRERLSEALYRWLSLVILKQYRVIEYKENSKLTFEQENGDTRYFEILEY